MQPPIATVPERVAARGRPSPTARCDREGEAGEAPGAHDERLARELPLRPIRDEAHYRRAIAVLDRLFTLGREKAPGERRYFEALARLACEFETARAGAE